MLQSFRCRLKTERKYLFFAVGLDWMNFVLEIGTLRNHNPSS